MSTLRLLLSESSDPWFNLAVEECIFHQMPPTQRVLFLWRNAETVVTGRAQNPWKECNTRRMAEDGIRLARRRTVPASFSRPQTQKTRTRRVFYSLSIQT